MINIRQDLIQKELQRDIKNGYIYHKFNLHNKFIDKLLNHYYCHEMCKNWYAEVLADEIISNNKKGTIKFKSNGKKYILKLVEESED